MPNDISVPVCVGTRIKDGWFLLEQLKPGIYDEEQGRYLSVGDKVADAFRTGADFKRLLDAGAKNIKDEENSK